MKVDLQGKAIKELDFSSHDPSTATEKERTALRTIEEIDASDNEISLVKRLDVFPNLVSLQLAKNRLASPISFFVRHIPPTIRTLDLSHNEITSIEGGTSCQFGWKHDADGKAGSKSPEAVTETTDLLRREVNFSTLVNLEQLNISFNSVVSPEKVGVPMFPSALVVLDVSYNQITQLAPLLVGLCNLEVLNAEGNSIHRFEEAVAECHTLGRLYLSGNPLIEELGPRYRHTVLRAFAEKGSPRLHLLDGLPVEASDLEAASPLQRREEPNGDEPRREVSSAERTTEGQRGVFSLASEIASQVRSQRAGSEPTAPPQQHSTLPVPSTRSQPEDRQSNNAGLLPNVQRARARVVADPATPTDLGSTRKPTRSYPEEPVKSPEEESISDDEDFDDEAKYSRQGAYHATRERRDRDIAHEDDYYDRAAYEEYLPREDAYRRPWYPEDEAEREVLADRTQNTMHSAFKSKASKFQQQEARIKELQRIARQLEHSLSDGHHAISVLSRENASVEAQLRDRRRMISDQLKESAALKAERKALLSTVESLKMHAQKASFEIEHAERAAEHQVEKSARRQRSVDNQSASTVRKPLPKKATFRNPVTHPPRMTNSYRKRLETTQKKLQEQRDDEEYFTAVPFHYDPSDIILCDGPSPYDLTGAIPLSPRDGSPQYRSPSAAAQRASSPRQNRSRRSPDRRSGSSQGEDVLVGKEYGDNTYFKLKPEVIGGGDSSFERSRMSSHSSPPRQHVRPDTQFRPQEEYVIDAAVSFNGSGQSHGPGSGLGPGPGPRIASRQVPQPRVDVVESDDGEPNTTVPILR